MQSRNDGFKFDPNNIAKDSVFFITSKESSAPFPPSARNFLLLDGTDFLLLDGTNFLLL